VVMDSEYTNALIKAGHPKGLRCNVRFVGHTEVSFRYFRVAGNTAKSVRPVPKKVGFETAVSYLLDGHCEDFYLGDSA
jgi:hypothetical protein